MAAIWVNGTKVAFDLIPATRGSDATLLAFLRGDTGQGPGLNPLPPLTGTKKGCGEGGCGACTVLISTPNLNITSTSDSISWRHRSVASCLFPLVAAIGSHVFTIEGLSNQKNGLHPIQKALIAANSSQCGFCTPGIVMATLSGLCSEGTGGGDPPPLADIEDVLDGNLCRCTGYRSILDGVKPLSGGDEFPSSVLLPGLEDVGQEMLELAGLSMSIAAADGSRAYLPVDVDEILKLKSGGVMTTFSGAHSYPMLVAGFTEAGYVQRYHPSDGPAPPR